MKNLKEKAWIALILLLLCLPQTSVGQTAPSSGSNSLDTLSSRILHDPLLYHGPTDRVCLTPRQVGALSSQLEYLLLSDAQSDGTVVVHETCEQALDAQEKAYQEMAKAVSSCREALLLQEHLSCGYLCKATYAAGGFLAGATATLLLVVLTGK